jgi:hypothetical protein
VDDSTRELVTGDYKLDGKLLMVLNPTKTSNLPGKKMIRQLARFYL